jgi:hypothetical protein
VSTYLHGERENTHNARPIDAGRGVVSPRRLCTSSSSRGLQSAIKESVKSNARAEARDYWKGNITPMDQFLCKALLGYFAE